MSLLNFIKGKDNCGQYTLQHLPIIMIVGECEREERQTPVWIPSSCWSVADENYSFLHGTSLQDLLFTLNSFGWLLWFQWRCSVLLRIILCFISTVSSIHSQFCLGLIISQLYLTEVNNKWVNSWIAQDVLSTVVFTPGKCFIGCCDLPPGFILACACVFIFNTTSCFKMCKLCHCGLKKDVVMAARGASVKSVVWGFSMWPKLIGSTWAVTYWRCSGIIWDWPS